MALLDIKNSIAKLFMDWLFLEILEKYITL